MINKINEIKEYTKDRLTQIQQYDPDKLSLDNVSDLHHELFNTSYYLVGHYQSKTWLGEDVFDAIEKIKNWCMDNFGECKVDFSSSERVANLLAYIIGEEVIADELNKLNQERSIEND